MQALIHPQNTKMIRRKKKKDQTLTKQKGQVNPLGFPFSWTQFLMISLGMHLNSIQLTISFKDLR